MAGRMANLEATVRLIVRGATLSHHDAETVISMTERLAMMALPMALASPTVMPTAS